MGGGKVEASTIALVLIHTNQEVLRCFEEIKAFGSLRGSGMLLVVPFEVSNSRFHSRPILTSVSWSSWSKTRRGELVGGFV